MASLVLVTRVQLQQHHADFELTFSNLSPGSPLLFLLVL